MRRLDEKTRNEKADYNNRFGDDPNAFSKFDDLFAEIDSQAITLEQEINQLTKNITSYTLHKDKIEIKQSGSITSYLFFDNPKNYSIAQIINLQFINLKQG
jgi:hypothetical protein